MLTGGMGGSVGSSEEVMTSPIDRPVDFQKGASGSIVVYSKTCISPQVRCCFVKRNLHYMSTNRCNRLLSFIAPPWSLPPTSQEELRQKEGIHSTGGVGNCAEGGGIAGSREVRPEREGTRMLCLCAPKMYILPVEIYCWIPTQREVLQYDVLQQSTVLLCFLIKYSYE